MQAFFDGQTKVSQANTGTLWLSSRGSRRRSVSSRTGRERLWVKSITKSQSALLPWGMKVSQQREDGIYFTAWLKSIWCVRCWGSEDEMSSRRLLTPPTLLRLLVCLLTMKRIECRGIKAWWQQLCHFVMGEAWGSKGVGSEKFGRKKIIRRLLRPAVTSRKQETLCVYSWTQDCISKNLNFCSFFESWELRQTATHKNTKREQQWKNKQQHENRVFWYFFKLFYFIQKAKKPQ